MFNYNGHIDQPPDPEETSYTLKHQPVSTYQLDNEHPDDPEFEIEALVDVCFINNEAFGETVDVSRIHWIEHYKPGRKVGLMPGDKDFEYFKAIIIDDIENGVITFE